MIKTSSTQTIWEMWKDTETIEQSIINWRAKKTNFRAKNTVQLKNEMECTQDANDVKRIDVLFFESDISFWLWLDF